jgi:hypothetical protein
VCCRGFPAAEAVKYRFRPRKTRSLRSPAPRVHWEATRHGLELVDVDVDVDDPNAGEHVVSLAGASPVEKFGRQIEAG